MSIFWNTHPGVDGLAAGCIAIERAEKSRYHLPYASIAVGIAVPFAQHDVVFSAEVVVASVVGEYQPVHKQRVAVRSGVGRVFSKQRSASARQRLLLDLAQSEEQILAHFAQDDLLSHLKGGYVFAMLERPLLTP